MTACTTPKARAASRPAWKSAAARSIKTRWLWASVLLSSLAYSGRGDALPGTHAPAISTFDTRGSSVVLAYRNGFTSGTSRVFSYNANFTSTTGNFSAQFGAHYVQLRDEPKTKLLHGAAASGVGLFSIPLAERFDNGVPHAALALYVGSVPTAAVSGPRNFLTVPLALGTGVSLSPTHFWTITPWFEAAPSLNLDTFVSPFNLSLATEMNEDIMTASPSSQNDSADGEIVLDEADANRVIDDAVDVKFSAKVGMRAGLQSTMHLGDDLDFNLYANLVTFGHLFGGTTVLHVGAGLGWHWDDIVPAVLPARRRLSRESCEALEERFLMCPSSERWRRAPASPAASPAPAGGPSEAPRQNPRPREKPGDSAKPRGQSEGELIRRSPYGP